MNSECLVTDHGFMGWLEIGPYVLKEAKSVPDFVPPGRPVVYVFRLVKSRQPQEIRRLNGASDILRIGMSGNFGVRQGQRLRNYRCNHQKPNHRFRVGTAFVHRVMGCAVEPGWAERGTRQEARKLESELLEQYFEDHVELPPWNRSG